jgi:methylaspartate mutase epsilon subunit
MDLKNTLLDDNTFYSIREEILNHWPTGKMVNFDEAVEYQNKIPSKKQFAKKLVKAKEDKLTLVQPRAGVALVDEHISLLKHLQDFGDADLLPSTVDSYTRQNRYKEAEKWH